jgi:hypothetical protein
VSIDEQIRDTLSTRTGGDVGGGFEPAVLDLIVDRAEKRRRRKLMVGGVVLATAVAAISLIPTATEPRGSTDPVDTPTPTTFHGDDYVPMPVSPLDSDNWVTRGALREQWLSSLDGTPMRTQAQQVYDRARIGTRATALSLQLNRVTLEIGAPRMHEPSLQTVRTITGTYEVRGHTLTLRLDGLGESTYRWREETSGVNDSGHRLWLEYVDGAGPSQYGASPEVLLRMLLTSSYFSYHDGF